MNNAIYWIWLQNALGCGSRRTSDVLKLGGTAREIFEMREDELRSIGAFRKAQLESLADKDLSRVQDIMTRCARLGIDMITADDEEYPEMLLHISAPPAVLYVKGRLPADRLCVAVVGSRDASQTGLDTAYTLAYGLAESGAVVVSGGARGIDSAAHMGALAASGETVAVLGCGIDYEYNTRGVKLRTSIAAHGAVISEYPPGTPPIGRYFPERNRLISGLSRAVAVVEAGVESGSLITANLAAEQGRDVFAAVTADGSPMSEGAAKLIENGVAPLSSASDITRIFADAYPDTLSEKQTCVFTEGLMHIPGGGRQTDPVKVVLEQRASGDAKRIYELLTKNGKMQFDDIIREVKLPTGKVLGALTELELLGMIHALPGRVYES